MIELFYSHFIIKRTAARHSSDIMEVAPEVSKELDEAARRMALREEEDIASEPLKKLLSPEERQVKLAASRAATQRVKRRAAWVDRLLEKLK